MPDIAAFADDLRQAFEQLRALPVAVATQVAAPAKRPARRRTAPGAPATAARRPVKKAARRSRASAPAGRAAGR
jgi:hypothetical protein